MNLKIGSTGTLVVGLQKALGVNADGIFGPQTEIAVRNYQAAHGLVVDGIVGPQTASKLAMLNPPAPTPGEWDGSFVLGIDVARYQVNLNTPAEWKALWDMGVRWMYPKFSDGESGPDSQGARLKKEGKAAGMISSPGYCFFRFDHDPVAQAKKLVALTGPVQVGELPHVLDVEWDNNSSDKGYHDSEHGGTRGTIDAAGRDKVYTALTSIEQLTGVTPWMYTSAGFWVGDDMRFKRFPCIIANYSKGTADNKIKVPVGLTLVARQYTDKIVVGDVDGIDGDRFLGTLAQLKAYVKA